ncbi:cytochrome P450 [Polymorphobacter sp. PAMC 29334]|uniref:cytochrome P450 n=1 Tax=Polymorphobacter sp. PAMC 29334 TaxID=2862331 RepID=UPI001D003C58|nr:cytochrome P450 [Polymorphobacter sp. PAMC 29334]
MGEAPNFSFDPTDPRLLADPYPVFNWLRDNDPVHWSDGGYWVVTRYDDVRGVLMDREHFGQGDFIKNIQLFYGPDFDVLAHASYRWLSEVFVFQDPPRHTRLRGLVTQALTAKRVAAMRPRVQAICNRLIDGVEASGGMEAIHDFAYRLPTLVMCDMLGITEDEASDTLLSQLNLAIAESFLVFGMEALPPAILARADRQMEFLENFFQSIFDRRRIEPRDDVATGLLNAREGTSALTNREMVTVAIALFGAGFETTAHMIGNGLLTLQRHPAEWSRLVAQPELARAATEEILRYESSLVATYRTALSDTSVGGKAVTQGQRVLCIVAAGNHDPAVFDAPERFDIARGGAKHLSFGGGIHFCVGAELARLEGEIALETITRRLPNMIVDSAVPAWRDGLLFRGLNRLDARWAR